MLLVILGLTLGLGAGFIYLYEKEDTWIYAIVCSVVLSCVELLILTFMLVEYPYNVDKKLEMYQIENQNIEIKVKETVRAYMDYEKETYTKLVETADLTTLLIKYPELNSNELIKEEIATYKENNKQIKSLKEKQIDRPILAWWLYFGN